MNSKDFWLLLALLATFLAAAGPAVGQEVHPYPGAPPCDGTLQACVSGVAPGDIVEIVDPTPIAETVLVDQSLTLRSAVGVQGTLGFGHHLGLRNLPGASNVVEVSGLTLLGGQLDVIQAGELPFQATIRDVVLEDAGFGAIEVRDTPEATGSLTFEIVGNVLRVPSPDEEQTRAIVVGATSGVWTGRIHRNVVEVSPGGYGGGIEVFNFEGEIQVDITHNEITGAEFETGIGLRQQGPGSIDARVVGNLVVGQLGTAGAPASIAATSDGVLDAVILNNTLADGETGLLLGIHSAESEATVVVANNIVAGMSQWGIHAETGVRLVPGPNLFHDTTANVPDLWPEVLVEAPEFVPEDYRLLRTSPAVDAGAADLLEAGEDTDLDDLPRVSGPEVDFGAYEYQQLPAGVCPALPQKGCHRSYRASISIDERRPMREKVRGRLRRFDPLPPPEDFGDPVGGPTHYTVCLYTPDGLLADFGLDAAGRNCGRRGEPCWSEGRKGFSYRDRYALSDGLFKFRVRAGSRSEIRFKAQNHVRRDQTSLQTGLAAALRAENQLGIQVHASDAACFSAIPLIAESNDGLRFRGRLDSSGDDGS